MNGLLKNAKNLYFLGILDQNVHFWKFLVKMGKTGIFSKKSLEHFCRAYKPQLTANFQKKSNELFSRNCVTYERTDERMDGRTKERTRLLRSQRPVGRETKKICSNRVTLSGSAIKLEILGGMPSIRNTTFIVIQ